MSNPCTGGAAVAHRQSFAVTAFVLVCLGLNLAAVTHAADWRVQEAPIRFSLELNRNPTHASCGYFAQLPDGGILPGPSPVTHVFSERGKPLASYALWHAAGSGMAIVFEAPKDGSSVDVYVSGGRGMQLWNEASGLTPSAILCADPTVGNMAAAHKLGKLGTVGPTVNYRNDAGIDRAPLCISGDLSGRPRPCSFYMLAYLVSDDPGKTWVAPFTIDGTCEVRINNQVINPQKRIDKWGGTGQWVEISKKPNRLDVFAACGGTERFEGKKGGVMYLTWKTPHATIDELGGPRPKDVPMPGTSKQETRVLRKSEIARSGACSVTDVRSRDGNPVPCIAMQPAEIYWIGDEPPLLIYRMQAMTRGNPRDTAYTWQFGAGTRVAGPKTSWWFPGFREQSVALSTSANGKEMRCVHPFYTYATVRSSLDDPAVRGLFRDTALTVMQAYPADADPTANWDTATWNNFFRTLELGEGQDLLMHIFAVRWAAIRSKIPPEGRQMLIDCFLDGLPRLSPHKAMEWTEKLEKESSDRLESAMMQVNRAEIDMYYLNDMDAARKDLTELIRKRGTDEASQLAKIRWGDMEFMAGKLNEATACYGDVQNRVNRAQLHRLGGGARSLSALERRLAFLKSAPRLARSKAEMHEQKNDGKETPPEEDPSKPRSFQVAPPPSVQDWKLDALLDVSASENVRTLVDQGYLLEAKQGLREWELESPMSKVSSDFILVESMLYMKLKDWNRARAMLVPYCEQIDASSFIAPAAAAALECMINAKQPREQIEAFYERMKKKLKFHPAAVELDHLMDRL